MSFRHIAQGTLISTALALLAGCSLTDEDYRTGMYWIDSDGNYQMAVRCFEKSLANYPKRWKSHKMLLESLSHTDEVAKMEHAIAEVLRYYPDSARSTSVVTSGTALLGRERFERLASSIELKYIGERLAKKGENDALLSRAVMASARAQDTVAAMDYLERLLAHSKSGDAPDSVLQEMRFFIGPARVHWKQLELKIQKNPQDRALRLEQLNAGLVSGDSLSTLKKLRDAVRAIPDIATDKDVAGRFGLLTGYDPFKSKPLVDGQDGCYSPDGKRTAFVWDRGKQREHDYYLYVANADGSAEKPIMKAAQMFIKSVAMPCFSPDGRWIYFYGSPDKDWRPGGFGAVSFYRIEQRYGAQPQKFGEGSLLPVMPHFTSDGWVQLVKRDIGSTRASVEIIRFNPATGKSETISRVGEPVSGAVFTAVGDSLLFTTDRGLFRRSINGGNITVDLAWKELRFPHLSPDGSKLIMQNSAGQMIMLDRRSGAPTFLGSTASPVASFDAHDHLLVTLLKNGKPTLTQLDISLATVSTENFAATLK